MASRRLPRAAVAVDAQLNDRRVHGRSPREVLLVGELGIRQRAELIDRGAVVTDAETLYEAFEQLAERSFDVVLVNPNTESCGYDLVSAIKEGETEHQLTIATLYGVRATASFLRDTRPPSQEMLEAARLRHRATPFVVLPGQDDWHYTVIVVALHASIVKDARVLPLVTMVMTVDAATLIGNAKPMA